MEFYAFYPFEYGHLMIGYTEKAVTLIKRTDHVSPSECSVLSDSVYLQIREYFAGERKSFDFPMEFIGTDFQKKVWSRIVCIPFGETSTYGQIAKEIGNPKASRAVGAACHKNPIWIAMPCHRVVGADGSMTGYAGGLEMKAFLLKLEGFRAKK